MFKKVFFLCFLFCFNNLSASAARNYMKRRLREDRQMAWEKEERTERNKRIESFLKNRDFRIVEILQILTPEISNEKLNNLFIESVQIFSSECIIKALKLGANKLEDAIRLIQEDNENCNSKIIRDEKELIISLLNKNIKIEPISKEILNTIKILPELNNIIVDYFVDDDVLKDNNKCAIL